MLKSIKTLFLPHSTNKTTLVAHMNSSIFQPYYLIHTKKNEVIRSMICGNLSSTEVVLCSKSGGNEVANFSFPSSVMSTAKCQRDKVSSLRDFGGSLFRLFRRLKPPVNRVTSLQDFTAKKLIRQLASDTTVVKKVILYSKHQSNYIT